MAVIHRQVHRDTPPRLTAVRPDSGLDAAARPLALQLPEAGVYVHISTASFVFDYELAGCNFSNYRFIDIQCATIAYMATAGLTVASSTFVP